MFFDIALIFDPETRRGDWQLGDDGDLVIDETPITPILLSVGLDRRANPDDDLPEGRSQFLTPTSFSERRGSAGDGIDPFGDLTGNRMWLLDRAKETETTRELGEHYLGEGLAWARKDTGQPAELDVAWVRPGVLSYRVRIEDVSVSLSRRVGV